MILLNNNEVKFNKFPNNETLVPNFSNLDVYSHNDIVFKYENDSDLIKLMFLKKYLDSLYVEFTSLIITYMPYSRMDRVEIGNAFTLKYTTEFINSLKFDRVFVIEPHSDVTVALLNNAVAKYINFDLLPKVLDDMEFDKEKDYLFFPDAGAQKRYHSLTGYKQLVGFKNRDFETGEIKSLQVVGQLPSTTEYSRVLIVDDLSSYGGTFIHSVEALNSLGFGEVNLLVAHAENSIFKKKDGGDDQLFDFVNHVYTTNTILTEQYNWENAKYLDDLTVYDIRKELS